MDAKSIYAHVNERYGATARANNDAAYGQTVASAFGYSADELASIPHDANLGLSCGNPLALASLRPGETIVDLGSGAGFDVFLAAQKIGETGKAIGVDMNEDMLAKARHIAQVSRSTNTSFVFSKITEIGLPDSTADVVISNCVINLVPQEEKHEVFREAFRILKPGGRVAVSDILTKKPLTEQMMKDIALYVGCVAGASSKSEYEGWLRAAGFKDVQVADAHVDLNVYTQTGGVEATASGCCASTAVNENPSAVSCCGATETKGHPSCFGSEETTAGGVVNGMKSKFADVDLNEWAGSYKIFAIKPSG